MTSGFSSTPGDLATHSATVSRLGKQLQDAANTGQNVDLGGETYGIIGQAFAGNVKDEIAQTAEAIAELAAGLSAFGEGVDHAGQHYQQVEDEIQQLLKEFGTD